MNKFASIILQTKKMKYTYSIIKYFKYQVSLLIFLFFCSNAWSQESSFNLYSNWSYFPNTHIYSGDSKVGYSGLSFSYKKMNRKLRFHEFELKTGLRFRNTNEASGSRVYNHFRYELGKQKPLGSSEKFVFEYGGGLRLFHSYRMTDPQATNLYRNSNSVIGIGPAFLTGFTYNFTGNFYVQLKAILFDLTFKLNTAKNDNPNIAQNLRNSGHFDIDLKIVQGLRFGIGYKIGKR